MHINSPIVHQRISSPYGIKYQFPAEHYIGTRQQQHQQLKFFARQQHLFSVPRYTEKPSWSMTNPEDKASS